MAKSIPRLTPASVLAVGGLLTVATAAAVSATSPEKLLADSFGTALKSEAASIRETHALKPVPIAGSEGYWLSALRHDGPAPLTKTVSIGDRISMTLAGIERHLQVISVAEFEQKDTAIDSSAPKTRFVLVTARDEGDATARPIRFAVELQTEDVPAITTAARTL